MQNMATWIVNLLTHHFLKDVSGAKKDDFVLQSLQGAHLNADRLPGILENLIGWQRFNRIS